MLVSVVLQCSEGNVAVGFSGIRNYSATPGSEGDIFSSGFSFNVPVQELADAFEEGDLRKDVAVLDIDAWAHKPELPSEQGMSILVFSTENTFQEKEVMRRKEIET